MIWVPQVSLLRPWVSASSRTAASCRAVVSSLSSASIFGISPYCNSAARCRSPLRVSLLHLKPQAPQAAPLISAILPIAPRSFCHCRTQSGSRLFHLRQLTLYNPSPLLRASILLHASEPRARSRAKSPAAPGRQSPPAPIHPGSPAQPQPHPPGRSPYPAKTDPRYIDDSK